MRRVARSDKGDGLGGKEGVEIANGHDVPPFRSGYGTSVEKPDSREQALA
jgi:hypothetical protein